MLKSMSSAPFLMTIIAMSYILCFMLNSWVMIWMALEMNTVAFCFMTKSYTSSKKAMAEISMKYFIIQSVASAILLYSSLLTKTFNVKTSILMIMSTMSLGFKSAMSPFHQWFMKMMKSILWKQGTLLMTWQKLAPIYLLTHKMKSVTLFFILMSMIIGSVSQMNKKNMMEIMGASSVFNSSWMALAMTMSTKLLLLFSLLYWYTVVISMWMLKKMTVKSLISEQGSLTKKWFTLLTMASIAGVPPLTGFIPKWLVSLEMITNKMIFMTVLILMMSSINMYAYMRMVKQFMMKNSSKTQKMSENNKPLMMLLNVMMNMLTLPVLIF